MAQKLEAKLPKITTRRKTINNTIKKDKQTKTLKVWNEEYFDLFTLRVKPVSDAFIEKVAEGLIKWADLKSSFRISDFYMDRGMDNDDFYRWIKRNKNMKRAHKYAMSRIGSRREKGAMFNELNVTMVTKTLGHYCEIYEKEEQKRSDQRQKENVDNQKTVVVIEKVPNCDKVPPKKIPTE